jgi:hypothetical protein
MTLSRIIRVPTSAGLETASCTPTRENPINSGKNPIPTHRPFCMRKREIATYIPFYVHYAYVNTNFVS